jgi:disulfide bond formation protein DsbB
VGRTDAVWRRGGAGFCLLAVVLAGMALTLAANASRWRNATYCHLCAVRRDCLLADEREDALG